MDKEYVIIIGEMMMPNKNAAAQRTWALCNSILDMGYVPIVIGLANIGESKVLNTYEMIDSVICYSDIFPVTLGQRMRRMCTIKPFVSVVEKYGKLNIKAIIAQEHESISLLRLKWYCSRNGIKLIIDTFEWYEKSRLSFPIGIIKNIDTYLRMKIIYPRVKYMFCISKYLYDFYKDKVANIKMIPGTIVPTDKKWDDTSVYSRNDIFTIGYAGSPARKGEKERADWIVEAVCKLNTEGIPCRVVFVGNKNKELIEEFRPELKMLPYYNEAIIYMGRKTNEECIAIIRKCDFTIIAREDKRVTRAGFPTKLSESLGAGTPVITTPSSNVSDYIKIGINGVLTEQCSYESLKDGIIEAYRIFTNRDMEKMHKEVKLNNPLVYSNYTSELKALIG